jgi:hypothetical protein
VNETTPNDQQLLHEQIASSRGRIDQLLGDLGAIDAQLEGLGKERHQYGLLHEACDALEELGALGAGPLFWGDLADSDVHAHVHLRGVRDRVEVFEGRIREIEVRRADLEARVREEEQNAECLADDLFEAIEQEERRKLEWVIDRDVPPPWRDALMPWTRGGDDDQRFRKALAAAFLVSLLLGLVFPMIDLPLPEPTEVLEVPERLARLIQPEQRTIPPSPQREETRPEPEPPEESPLLAEESTTPPTPKPAPTQTTASKGILAFREKFSSLSAPDASDRLGAHARISTSGEGASGRPQRSMVTTQAPGSSGGINLASLSRDLGGGGGQIQGVEVARATSSIGTGGTGDRPRAGGGPGSARTDEEIQIVFDRHKAALYRLYNRELRRDPTLRGQMVLRLRIEPDGGVSLCEVKGTDMKAPTLSAQVVARVRTFDFGAKDDIPAVTILYPIDFLPAT